MTELHTPASALAAAVGATSSAPAAPAQPPAAGTPATAHYGFEVMELAAIVPHSANVRTIFNAEALQALADNIKTAGLLQPILVRPLPGARLQETWTDRRKGDKAPTHEIIAGERRYRAARLAGLRTVPVMVRPMSDADALRMQVIENVQRESLHPLEEAEGFHRLLHLEGEASKPMADRMAELAAQIKKSTRYIYQTLQLRKLAEFPRQVFMAGKMDRSIALEVATIGNEAQQVEACRKVAGLAKTGMEVVDHPLSLRAAAEYIRNNHRLLLAKAPFPVKVTFAGVGPCTDCDKMSANARELFDEGAKVPDTCMDRSCYGKKNAAHFEQLAEAARKAGQRVATPKEAKKILPYEGNPDHVSHSSDYESVEDRRYEGSCGGKTLRQLLGNDMPKPMLVPRPDGQGFVEVLPRKDVERLLKDKGLLKTPSIGRNPQAEAEAKARKVKAFRMELASQVLDAARKWPAAPPAAADAPKDTTALLSALLLPLATQAWHQAGHDTQQRAMKLLDWTQAPSRHERGAMAKRLQAMDAVEFNRFVLALLMAPHAGCNAYSSDMGTPTELAHLADLMGVDAKKLKSDMEAAERTKAIDKTKPKAPAKKATAGARPTAGTTPAPAAPADTKTPKTQATSAPAAAAPAQSAEKTTAMPPLTPMQAWPFPTPKK